MPRRARSGALNILAAAALLTFPRVGAGAQPAREGQTSGDRAASSAEQTDQAKAALKQTCARLASAKTLTFRVRNLVPTQGSDGAWFTLVGAARVMREGDRKLFAESGGDLFPFSLYFDGETLTAFAPTAHVYAQKQSPGTIDAMLAREERLGETRFVFADLVSADPCSAMTKGLRSARVVGTSTIDGVTTRHLAVHGQAVDWEIWIGTEDQLPRMVTLTDNAEARKPTQTVMLSEWGVDQALPPDTFTFRDSSGATQIPFRSPSQAKAAARRPSPGARP